MHLSVLEEFAGRDHALHHRGGCKMVVHAVLLTSARDSGRVADHEAESPRVRLHQLGDECAFACS